MFAYPLTLKGEEAHNCAAGPGVGPVLPILALPHMTPLHMERHNKVIHIIHTTAHGKGIQSRGLTWHTRNFPRPTISVDPGKMHDQCRRATDDKHIRREIALIIF